jgi:hypothetical protein
MFTVSTTQSNWMICCHSRSERKILVIKATQLKQVALMVVRIPVLESKMR